MSITKRIKYDIFGKILLQFSHAERIAQDARKHVYLLANLYNPAAYEWAWLNSNKTIMKNFGGQKNGAGADPDGFGFRSTGECLREGGTPSWGAGGGGI